MTDAPVAPAAAPPVPAEAPEPNPTPRPAPPWRSWLAAGLRRFWPLLLVVLAILVYALPREQTFIVEAQSWGADIVHDGSPAGQWRIEAALLCISRLGGTTSPDALPGPAIGDCPDAIYTTLQPEAADIDWPPGTATTLRATAEGGMALEITALPPGKTVEIGDARLGPGSRILVTPQAWRGHPALPVSGVMTIGLLPRAGEEGFLRRGRYQVNETLPLRQLPTPMLDGPLFPGDQVRFEARAAPLWPGSATTDRRAFGFVGPAIETDGGFTIVAYTETGHNRMRIDRVGAATSLVEVYWTHRILRDPVLLALAATLGVLGALVGMARPARGDDG